MDKEKYHVFGLVLTTMALLTGCHARLVDPYCLQGPASGVNAMACCPIPDFMAPAVVDKCEVDILGDEDSPMDMAYGMTQEDVLFWPGIRCIAQCIMIDAKALVNDTVNVERAIQVLVQQFDDSEVWLPVLQKAMQTCALIVSKTPFKKTPKGECSFMPAFYMACVDTQIFQNCPESKWVDEYGCAQLKQDAARCPVLAAVLASSDN